MANQFSKVVENEQGSFFVDSECIACETCVQLAPLHFQMSGDNRHAFVRKQPKTPHEILRCQEAITCCPVDAIGDNG